jgi:hypothetical protein
MDTISLNINHNGFLYFVPITKKIIQGIFLCNWVLSEADTITSSSILIYSLTEHSIYTQCDRHDAVLIKAVIKIRSELKGVNEMLLIKNESLEIDYEIKAKCQNILPWKLYLRMTH